MEIEGPALLSAAAGANAAVPGWMESVIWIFSGLLSIPILVLANGFFVAAEFALVAVRRTRVRELVEQGVSGARAVERAIGNLDRYIAATQLGITLTSISLGWLGEPALANLLVPLFHWLGPQISPVAAHSLAFGIAFMAIAFVHVVLGELAPKTIALQIPDRVALWVVPLLLIFEHIFRPFIWALNSTGMLFARMLGFAPTGGGSAHIHSLNELSLLLEASERAGVLERHEREMMHGVLAFGDMTVSQIMIPREMIVSVSISTPATQIAQIALETGYSRLPVYDSSPDDIIGVLHTKDLLGMFAETGRELVVIQDLLRQPYFTKGNTRVLDLLREFQRGEQHLALVQDDFGELIGLATLEDLLEEIVGEIKDEHDLGGGLLLLDTDGSFQVGGEASARDSLSDLGIVPPLWAGGALSDFLRQLKKGPLATGDRISYQDLVFEVLEGDGEGGATRIRAVKGGK